MKLKTITRLLAFIVLLASCNDGSNIEKRIEELRNHVSSVKKNPSPTLSEINEVIGEIEMFEIKFPRSDHQDYLNRSRKEMEEIRTRAIYDEHVKSFNNLLKARYIDPDNALEDFEREKAKLQSPEVYKLQEQYTDLKTYVPRLEAIIEEIESMRLFFSRDFANLSAFNEEAHAYGNKSMSPTAKRIWEVCLDAERNKIAQKMLNAEVEKFKDYLMKDAEEICMSTYSGFDIKRIDVVSIDQPIKREGFMTYDCEGTFRVYMIGSILGWHKGNVKISVKGKMGVYANEQEVAMGVKYSRTDFSVLEENGDL